MAEEKKSDYTLYVDDSPASQEAMVFLEAAGIKVDVKRPDRSDFSNMVVPYLVTILDYGYTGLEKIRFFISVEPEIREYTEGLRKRARELCPQGRFVPQEELEEFALLRNVLEAARIALSSPVSLAGSLLNPMNDLHFAIKHYDDYVSARKKGGEQEPSQPGFRQYHREFTLSSLKQPEQG